MEEDLHTKIRDLQTIPRSDKKLLTGTGIIPVQTLVQVETDFKDW